MKRSIISLSIFLFLIAGGVLAEFLYTRNLAITIDTHLENYEPKECAQKLKDEFEKRNLLNRIFLRENIVERFDNFFIELEYSDENETKTIIEKIKIYTKDLKTDRTF